MSTNEDTYLVEKLREILSRIYKSRVSPTSASSSQIPLLSPSLAESDALLENYSVRFLKDQKKVFENKRLLENSTGRSEDDTDDDAHTEYLLRENLNEFIQVLKMSLIKSQESGGGGPGTMSSNLSPVITLPNPSSSDMDFNLTLDDISDLNRLMDGGNGMPLKHVFLIMSYFMIACIAIIGNALVVQLVIRSRRLHTLTHALLANLAVADLLMATINIPFSAARVILTEWPFGAFLCQAVPFIQVTSVYVTSITMAVIALDRYQVIMKPLGHRLKGAEGFLLVIGIWTLSGTFSLPFALHHKVVTILTVRVVRRCQAEFTSRESRQWLTVLTFLAQYLAPLMCTTASYGSIMHRLGHRSSGLGSTTPRQAEAQSRAKRKTIKMLVLTVIFFAACWAPINVYHLLTHFNVVRHDSTAILICHLVAMSSSCYNPFIYCWLNEHFRGEALKWFRCFRTRRSPLVHPGVEVNGMLTRADLVCRRNQSTTMVHTLSFRSHIPPSPNFVEVGRTNPRRGYRPEAVFLALPSRPLDDVLDRIGVSIEDEPEEELRVNNCNNFQVIANSSSTGQRNFISISRGSHSHGGSNVSLSIDHGGSEGHRDTNV